MRHKKETPAAVRTKRGKIILTALACMAAAIVLIPNGKHTEEDNSDPTETAMDAGLDSLMRTLGFNTYEIQYRGDIETLKTEETCEAEIELDIAKERIRQISMKDIPEARKRQLLSKETARRDSLQKEATAFRQNYEGETYRSRRIRFTTPDGKRYTFFQQLHGTTCRAENLHESKLTRNTEYENR